MKAFLNTLWDYEPKPSKLLFINNGVRLTTEGSEVLATLGLLEEKGVQVFSLVPAWSIIILERS